MFDQIEIKSRPKLVTAESTGVKSNSSEFPLRSSDNAYPSLAALRADGGLLCAVQAQAPVKLSLEAVGRIRNQAEVMPLPDLQHSVTAL